MTDTPALDIIASVGIDGSSEPIGRLHAQGILAHLEAAGYRVVPFSPASDTALVERLNERAKTCNGALAAHEVNDFAVGYYGAVDRKLDREAAARLTAMQAELTAKDERIVSLENDIRIGCDDIDRMQAELEAVKADDDETYEIGKRDGYDSAIQDLDLATGGDGEFRGSTFPGRTVDVPVMKQRIIDRFNALDRAEAAIARAARKPPLAASPTQTKGAEQ